MSENVTVKYDPETDQYESHYRGLDTPVASCGDTREEALANLVEAVALYLSDRVDS